MKKKYSNSNNTILNVLLAIASDNEMDMISIDMIENTIDIYRSLATDKEVLYQIDMPDLTVNGLMGNKYVEAVDLAGNVHISMTEEEMYKELNQNEKLANVLYIVLFLLSDTEFIQSKVSVNSSYVIENSDRDYYLTSQESSFYEEKIYTDGDVEILEKIEKDNYSRLHLLVNNSSYSIILCKRKDENLKCVARSAFVDIDYICEKINDIDKGITDYYKEEDEKVYKLLKS